MANGCTSDGAHKVCAHIKSVHIRWNTEFSAFDIGHEGLVFVSVQSPIL